GPTPALRRRDRPAPLAGGLSPARGAAVAGMGGRERGRYPVGGGHPRRDRPNVCPGWTLSGWEKGHAVRDPRPDAPLRSPRRDRARRPPAADPARDAVVARGPGGPGGAAGGRHLGRPSAPGRALPDEGVRVHY